jgi:uncharacterized GH25 family protein
MPTELVRVNDDNGMIEFFHDGGWNFRIPVEYVEYDANLCIHMRDLSKKLWFTTRHIGDFLEAVRPSNPGGETYK